MTYYVSYNFKNEYMPMGVPLDKNGVLACQSFGERAAKVKLELTDFSDDHSIEVEWRSLLTYLVFG